MAQYRQSGYRDHDLLHHHSSNGAPDRHLPPIGARAAAASAAAQQQHKPGRGRRSARSEKGRRCSIGAVAVALALGLAVTLLAYYCLSRDGGGQFPVRSARLSLPPFFFFFFWLPPRCGLSFGGCDC